MRAAACFSLVNSTRKAGVCSWHGVPGSGPFGRLNLPQRLRTGQPLSHQAEVTVGLALRSAPWLPSTRTSSPQAREMCLGVLPFRAYKPLWKLSLDQTCPKTLFDFQCRIYHVPNKAFKAPGPRLSLSKLLTPRPSGPRPQGMRCPPHCWVTHVHQATRATSDITAVYSSHAGCPFSSSCEVQYACISHSHHSSCCSPHFSEAETAVWTCKQRIQDNSPGKTQCSDPRCKPLRLQLFSAAKAQLLQRHCDRLIYVLRTIFQVSSPSVLRNWRKATKEKYEKTFEKKKKLII